MRRSCDRAKPINLSYGLKLLTHNFLCCILRLKGSEAAVHFLYILQGRKPIFNFASIFLMILCRYDSFSVFSDYAHGSLKDGKQSIDIVLTLHRKK